MNTVRSVGYGWAVLIVAGGGSYYFAKRQINADREARALAEEKRRQHAERLRAQEYASRESKQGLPLRPGTIAGSLAANSDHPSPSQEDSKDPAPVTHAQQQGALIRGKYEASEPYRMKKGDRFS